MTRLTLNRDNFERTYTAEWSLDTTEQWFSWIRDQAGAFERAFKEYKEREKESQT